MLAQDTRCSDFDKPLPLQAPTTHIQGTPLFNPGVAVREPAPKPDWSSKLLQQPIQRSTDSEFCPRGQWVHTQRTFTCLDFPPGRNHMQYSTRRLEGQEGPHQAGHIHGSEGTGMTGTIRSSSSPCWTGPVNETLDRSAPTLSPEGGHFLHKASDIMQENTGTPWGTANSDISVTFQRILFERGANFKSTPPGKLLSTLTDMGIFCQAGLQSSGLTGGTLYLKKCVQTGMVV